MNQYVKKYLPTLFGIYYNSLSAVAPDLAARQAFRTFTKVRKGRLNAEQQAYLEEARKERLKAAGHEIQVYHWPGKKERVLLVHGWESNTYRWRYLVQQLRQADFDIIAFDAPGHGASTGAHLHVLLYADCLDLVVDQYGPKALVGHSVGGMTALYSYHRNRYQEVQKIVTLGSPAEFKDIMEHFQGLLDLRPGLMQAIHDYIAREYGVQVNDFSSPVFVRDTDLHGLLLHDRQDTITPFRASELVHAHWKKSRLIATEGLGHSLQKDEVHRQVLEFLQQGL